MSLQKILFASFSFLVIAGLIWVGNTLVSELAEQEKDRMNLWASATQRIAEAESGEDFEFLLGIISRNTTIPVLVADSLGNVLDFRNFTFANKEDNDAESYEQLSLPSRKQLFRVLWSASGGNSLETLCQTDPHFIKVDVTGASPQYIYYEDSGLLKLLGIYPYLLMAVMAILAGILYAASVYAKRAEQNRLWAGLSKETAHQLGTPISSLMAWNEYLATTGTDHEITEEINKDVQRLSVIAERFSKVGSVPELKPEDINRLVAQSSEYIRNRISDRVEVNVTLSKESPVAPVSASLFEWVMENLMKNAVDAMEGDGRLDIRVGETGRCVWIEVKDSGKGIPRKHQKDVFKPGFTTKKRGWGLGLALAKRIVDNYHKGRIFIKCSEPGRGTTFRIEIPS